MTNANAVQDMLRLRMPPVAIAFLDEVPAGLEPWRGPAQPAGCAFWQQAQTGAPFYTVPADHFNCAIGSYTHAIDLPPDRSGQLNETVGLMVESGYIEMTEIPGIPRLAKQPAAVAYGAADTADFEPDVVVLTANPAQGMLIYEAALRAGVGAALTNLLGRPTCAVLPLSLNNGQAAVSLGCAGNRLYAGLRDDELYFAIPGGRWQDFKTRLAEIVSANARMGEFYRVHQLETSSGSA